MWMMSVIVMPSSTTQQCLKAVGFVVLCVYRCVGSWFEKHLYIGVMLRGSGKVFFM